MDTRKVKLLVFDSQENFERSKEFLGEEGASFKKIICIRTAGEFQEKFSLFNDEDYVALVVHVFSNDHIRGIKRFLASGIMKSYAALPVMYISEGNAMEIKHKMVENDIDVAEIYKYHHVQSSINSDKIKVYTKKEILSLSLPTVDSNRNNTSFEKYPQIKYAIITALYEDEFEALKEIFDFPEEREIYTSAKTYYRGHLKSDATIEIVAAVPNATGMVDSSIIATQMLEFFRPKYLLMSGVCGGAPDLKFGDIVVAKQVYTFQKGKLSDVKRKTLEGNFEKIDLYDQDRNKVDYDHLYDEEGNQIKINIEKFEIEHDAAINLNTSFEDNLNTKLTRIRENLNREVKARSFIKHEKDIDIKVLPMACSTMVINKEGFFEDTIKGVSRKIAAVEMESYGVARACHFANGGQTIPIIFKSVMDHTSNKADIVSGVNYKKFAAFTSAQFMRWLFEEKVLK
jgi:nucleoside phosphorylase